MFRLDHLTSVGDEDTADGLESDLACGVAFVGDLRRLCAGLRAERPRDDARLHLRPQRASHS